MESAGQLFRVGQTGALACRWSLHGAELWLIPLSPEQAEHTFALDVRRSTFRRAGVADQLLAISEGGLTFYAPRNLLEPQLKSLGLSSDSWVQRTSHNWLGTAVVVVLAAAWMLLQGGG